MANPCYHCGEDCGKSPVRFDDKDFCCHGCKMVYEILSQSNSCEYYNYEQHPGIRLNSPEIGNRYAYLDNEVIRTELLEFSDGGVSKITFYIPSIHCSSCIWLLENLNRLQKGIIQSTVNFIKREVTLVFHEDQITLRQVVELLASIHYVPQISMDDLRSKNKKKENKSIYYKLGVAGFCFGNIMLFSFPEYLSGDQEVEGFLKNNLSWLNLALSLPVIFYSASDYFLAAYKGLRKKFISIDVPIALGILALFLQSVYEIITGIGPGYMDSMSGLVFFLLIGKWYQGKTYQAMSFERDYKSYFPVAVTTLDEDNSENIIPLKNLITGDRILVRNQELIPADSLLIKGDAHIDYSFVSGEATPVNKKVNDRIFAGGRQIGGAIELIVEREVTQSYLTELWNQDIISEQKETRLNSMVNRVSQYFTAAIILIALVTAVIWLTIDPSRALNAFTSVLIVACPCALALTIPFAFGSAMRIFGRNGFYLKKTDVIEQLARTDTIVFDKTGTITQNDQFEVDISNVTLETSYLQTVKSLVRQSTHPISTAIYRSIEGQNPEKITDFKEFPAQGIEGQAGDVRIRLGSEKFVTGVENEMKTYSTKVFISFNDEFRGYFMIRNKYRPGLELVISQLHKTHDLHLLSGDNDSEMSNLLPLFKHPERLKFKQTPADKLQYIKNLRLQGKQVLMAGDGLNDAGALHESNVGISVADDVYHFSPACDAILESKQFYRLGDFLLFTKTSMKIIKASFILSFLYNALGISLAAMGLFTPIISAILMPISSVTVVVFVTVATSFLAKKAGFK